LVTEVHPKTDAPDPGPDRAAHPGRERGKSRATWRRARWTSRPGARRTR